MLTFPPTEEVSSPPLAIPRQERRQLRVALRAGLSLEGEWVSVKWVPTQASCSHSWACQLPSAAPQHAVLPGKGLTYPRAPRVSSGFHGIEARSVREASPHPRGKGSSKAGSEGMGSAGLSGASGPGVSEEGREERKPGPAGLLEAAWPLKLFAHASDCLE